MPSIPVHFITVHCGWLPLAAMSHSTRPTIHVVPHVMKTLCYAQTNFVLHDAFGPASKRARRALTMHWTLLRTRSPNSASARRTKPPTHFARRGTSGKSVNKTALKSRFPRRFIVEKKYPPEPGFERGNLNPQGRIDVTFSCHIVRGIAQIPCWNIPSTWT